MKKNIASIGLILIIISTPLLARSNDVDNQAIIEDRIKPIGQVHLLQNPQPALITPALTPLSAKPAETKTTASTNVNEVYTKYCSVCHATGIANAPKFRDPSLWKPRMTQGINVLLEHVTNGFNAMPPKGTCSTCTPEELKAAIEYMEPK
ncbi:MAG: cytochrome c5 family protein [Proteobacteria bacterium]|nr:cytochrome c5 family protein [Pseudomonadota bacterium]